MLRPNDPNLKVYLHRAPIDMRTGRNGLAAIVSATMGLDPFDGALFLFIGKRFDSLKILGWDRNGYAIWHKVIQSNEKFYWPRLFEEDVVQLTSQQLEWLMDGYDVWSKPHQVIRFTHAN